MQDNARKWIKFLRRYGPISQNDNMYDEHIQRSSRRAKIRPISFERPQEKEIFECFDPNRKLTSVILTGTAGDGKTHLCRSVWQRLNGRDAELSEDYVSTQINHADGIYTLHVIKDLSEWSPQQGADWEDDKQELMQTFCRSLYEPNARNVFLIAANDGQLIGSMRRLQQSEISNFNLTNFDDSNLSYRDRSLSNNIKKTNNVEDTQAYFGGRKRFWFSRRCFFTYLN